MSQLVKRHIMVHTKSWRCFGQRTWTVGVPKAIQHGISISYQF